MAKKGKKIELLGSKGLDKPIWILLNISFDNYPDAEEVAESVRSTGIDAVVKHINAVQEAIRRLQRQT